MNHGGLSFASDHLQLENTESFENWDVRIKFRSIKKFMGSRGDDRKQREKKSRLEISPD